MSIDAQSRLSPDSTSGAASPSDPQGGDPAGIQPPIPELEALARLLSDRRQAEGLSVVELAQRLHMGVEQLKALERGDPQQLPEPVYVIAQARRVADALGVEISAQIEALRSSERFMAERPALKSDVFPTAVDRQRGAKGPRIKAQPAPAQAQPTTPAIAQATTQPLKQPRQHPHTSHPRYSNRNSSSQAGSSLAWLLLLCGVVAAGSWGWQQRQAVQPALATALQRWSPWLASTRRTGSLPPQARPQEPTAAAVRPAELQISARQPSWLEVRPVAGGKPLFRGTFLGERSFGLAQGLRLRAGRPDLVFVSDGSAAPKPLGTVSQIRWVTFRAQARPAPPQS
ncbi:MAG: helix-turn-helix domain-containing protein [Cyanobacteriota bacterium]|nr:helix-turn-helix domain-containing protein [Cyanobacteriota bacterium]